MAIGLAFLIAATLAQPVAASQRPISVRDSFPIGTGSETVCTAAPERRIYFAAGQTTSEVALCHLGLSDVYLVLGERRAGEGGRPAWLLRAYWNPFAKLIFLGPLLIALGGLVSLSDRRLRIGAPARRPRQAATAPSPAPAE